MIATVVSDKEPIVSGVFKNVEIHKVSRQVSDNVPLVSSVFKNVEIHKVR